MSPAREVSIAWYGQPQEVWGAYGGGGQGRSTGLGHLTELGRMHRAAEEDLGWGVEVER